MSTSHHITPLKQAEEAPRQSEELFRLLADSAKSPLVKVKQQLCSKTPSPLRFY